MNELSTVKPPTSEILASFRLSVSVAPATINADGHPSVFDSESYIWEQKESWAKELTDEINRWLEIQYGQDVHVVVVAIERGSIDALLAVVAAAGTVYEILSKWKDFYESLDLLKRQVPLVLDRVTRTVLFSRLGRVAETISVRIGTPNIGIPLRARVTNSGVRLRSWVNSLPRISLATFLISANLVITIMVLLILCGVFTMPGSTNSARIVITQVLSTTVPIAPSATVTPLAAVTLSPTVISILQPTSTPFPTSSATASCTPTVVTPTSTVTVSRSPTSSPSPTRITPTPTATPEYATLSADVSITTAKGTKMTLSSGTVVVVLERKGCQARIWLYDASDKENLQLSVWIDRSSLGEKC